VGKSKITGGQGSHNKRIGCDASGEYAPGPANEEEEEERTMTAENLTLYN
jgi:hypothetical protein